METSRKSRDSKCAGPTPTCDSQRIQNDSSAAEIPPRRARGASPTPKSPTQCSNADESPQKLAVKINGDSVPSQ